MFANPSPQAMSGPPCAPPPNSSNRPLPISLSISISISLQVESEPPLRGTAPPFFPAPEQENRSKMSKTPTKQNEHKSIDLELMNRATANMGARTCHVIWGGSELQSAPLNPTLKASESGAGLVGAHFLRGKSKSVDKQGEGRTYQSLIGGCPKSVFGRGLMVPLTNRLLP